LKHHKHKAAHKKHVKKVEQLKKKKLAHAHKKHQKKHTKKHHAHSKKKHEHHKEPVAVKKLEPTPKAKVVAKQPIKLEPLHDKKIVVVP
jgi:hypothetical protein